MKIKLNIKEYSWTEELNIPLFDREVSLCMDSKVSTGRRLALTKPEAIKIALMEAIERKCMKELKIENSSGCAAHDSRESAKLNARRELLERHVLFELFYLGGNYKTLSFSNIGINAPVWSTFLEFCKGSDIDLSFYCLEIGNEYFTCIQAIDGSVNKIRFGSCVSTTVQDSLESGFYKNMLEIFPSLAHYVLSGNSVSHPNSIKLATNTSRQHLEVVRSPAYSQELGDYLFILKDRKIKNLREIDYRFWSFDEFYWVQEVLKYNTGYFVSVSSEEASPFFFGVPCGKYEDYLIRSGSSRYYLPLPLA